MVTANTPSVPLTRVQANLILAADTSDSSDRGTA